MLQHLPLDQVVPAPGQPRKTFYEDSLEELAQSIKERGVLEPIVVRPMPDGTYQIIMGERRYRASRLAGLTEIPCIIRELSDEDARTDALLENFQREDLNPVERARAIEELLQYAPMEKVARTLGVKEATVRRHLEILELPNAVLEELVGREGEHAFTEGHARALRNLDDDPITQVRLARKVKAEGLAIDELQRLIQAIGNIPDKKEAFLRVPLSVAEEMIRQTARERGMKRTRTFKPQTAQTHASTLEKLLSQLTDALDSRVIEFLSDEERSTLLASCTSVVNGLRDFTERLRKAMDEVAGFQEVYINCALCGRLELIGTPRCSVCWSPMKRCIDCGHYDKTYQQCSLDGTFIPTSEAETPSETSRSYKCENYTPKFDVKRAA
ncbi:MAG: ParB/RepB/Spo0J family partition protein [Armatimonadetes bacterium]|nr:ParB/RepB/Spo0J family partition protein [Armatimonadota bacterium]